MNPFEHPAVRRLVAAALEEDVGRGDVTTEATIDRDAEAVGTVVSREPVVFAGGELVRVVLAEARVSATSVARVEDGMAVGSDAALCEIRGPARDVLVLERVILNFLQRLCGVATLTRRYVEAVAGTRARIVDTRKTIPGWRLLDKYAVTAGGGSNHRFGLDDGILIKDNHIVACGGVSRAIERARRGAPHLLSIEVECETMAEVDEAVAARADVILLDNMRPADLREAVRRIAGRALVEASGGITLESVGEVAEAGVDLISVGALTHSAPAVDLSMELSPLSGA